MQQPFLELIQSNVSYSVDAFARDLLVFMLINCT